MAKTKPMEPGVYKIAEDGRTVYVPTETNAQWNALPYKVRTRLARFRKPGFHELPFSVDGFRYAIMIAAETVA